jgi:predicted  nucleic acid-binding Zn-ribbon protein
MADTNQGLKALHDVHRRLQTVQEDLARGPRQTQFRKAAVDKKKAELEAQRQALKQAKLTADQKNLQLKTNEAKINDLRAKLNIVSSNREYEILTGQIAADTMANSVLEDEILEALTKIDQVQMEVKRAEQELATAEAELAKVLSDIAARETGLKQQAEQLQTEVAAAEKFLPGDVVPQYRRAVQAFGADALAPVENRFCTNCNIQLTSQKMVELKSGKWMFCSCARLLYAVD